jgi:hypothetical protein
MRKLESINECRGYLGVFVGKARADAMSGFEVAAAVREHGAELAPTVSFQEPPARADSVYREDASAKARPRDRRADAFASSFRREGESSAEYARRTLDAALEPSPEGTSKGGKDKRAGAFAGSFSPEAQP